MQTMQTHTKSANLFIAIILLVAGFIGVGVGVYFWSENQSLQREYAPTTLSNNEKSVQEASEQELSLSQGQSSQPDTKASGAIMLSQEIITGQAVRSSPEASVVIECFVLPKTLTTVWVQYGNTLLPQEQTSGIADGLDEGEAGMYMPIAVPIPDDAIESNALYSYQCVGADSQGNIRSAGVASFNVQ